MTYATQTPPTSRVPVRLPPVAPGPVRRRRPASWRRYGGWVFVLPYLALFGVFLVLPLAYGLGLSFMRYEMLSPEKPAFIGLDNYREALADPYFRKALGATAKFVLLASPLTVLTALMLALGIAQVPDRRQHVYRLAFFLPTMITISVAGILWRWLYSTEFGALNALLSNFGYKAPWLTDPDWAMGSIVLMTLWWTVGGPTIILLAGLRQIPDAYYEAASIDGATGWKSLFYITLPMLRPVLLFVVILNIIGAFQVFGQTFIITRGGPERSTLVLMQYIYETSFNHYRLGYGAAMSWLLFLLIAAFSLLQFRLMRER